MRSIRRKTGLLSTTSLMQQDDDMWDDRDEIQEEEEDERRVVILRDVAMDRVIECFVDREIEIEGRKYATLMPADTPVILAQYHQIGGNHQLIPITADHAIDELFPTASAVLAEMDLSLSRSAVFLTVEGGMYEDDSTDDDEEEDGSLDDFSLLVSSFTQPRNDAVPPPYYPLRREELVDPAEALPASDALAALEEDDDDSDSDEGGAGEMEQMEVLATFWHGGLKHVVAAPMEPVFVIGAPVPPNEARLTVAGVDLGVLPSDVDFVLPSRLELEHVTPLLEGKLRHMAEAETAEDASVFLARAALRDQWHRRS